MLLNLAILYHTIRCKTKAIRERRRPITHVWRSKTVELVVAPESLRVYTVSRTSNAGGAAGILVALRDVVALCVQSLACSSFMCGCKCLVVSVRRCEMHVECIHLGMTDILPEA